MPAMPAMPSFDRPLLLAHARSSDFVREFGRRVQAWLASLPDGSRWTGTDYVFAGIVALLALSSTGFFTAAYRTVASDPDYFSRRLIASMENSTVDPINTGTVAAPPTGVAVEAADVIPVPAVVRAKPLSPSDYEIVMIFGQEAMLATAQELRRVKVGSVLPGLGQVLAIDEATRSVRSEKATLKMAAQ